MARVAARCILGQFLLALLLAGCRSAVVDPSDPPATPEDQSARFSTSGEKVAFWREFDSTRPDGLYTVDADGANERRLLGGVSLAWGPGDTLLAVADSAYSLVVVTAQSGEIVLRLRDVGYPFGGVDWSPDGEWVTFNSSGYPNVGVGRVNVHTQEFSLLVGGSAEAARWSADSRWVVYSSDSGICIADSAGHRRRVLVLQSKSARFWRPCWFGDRVLCSYHCHNKLDGAVGLAVVDTDGTWRPLCLAGTQPDFCPATGEIVYTSSAKEAPYGAGRLFVVGADGANNHQLTHEAR
jgi:hypothetical protein